MYIKLTSNNKFNTGGGSSLAWGITFCAIWGFCSILGSFGIVWRSSWAGTLADYCVGLTQVQGRKIDNVLSKKFVTSPCNGVGLTPSFVWGFSLLGSLEWSGIISPWEWEPGGQRACGMWCFMLNSSPGPQIQVI